MLTMKSLISTPVWVLGVLSLVACESNNNDSGQGEPEGKPVVMATYEVSVTNVTANQPLSPIAVQIHDGDYQAWQIGQPASDGLEKLAESGDNTDFLAAGAASSLGQSGGEGVVMPGASASYQVEVVEGEALTITVASMLVNTNDAFVGVTGWPISDLSTGQPITVSAPIYDAGTEDNDEWMANIPGPAAGGEGYNAERNDRDIVTRHAGVVSADDGLAESVLDQSHRFDQGAMVVSVVRVK